MFGSRRSGHERLPALEYVGPNRLMCTVLDEMRECCKKLNFAPMGALIEEAQILANRMEAALEDQRDMRTMAEEVTNLKKFRKELWEECKGLLERKEQDGTKRSDESNTEGQATSE